MAVFREKVGWVRKASDQEAEAMQKQQAEATIRKLTRRLATVPAGNFKDFLIACRDDVKWAGR